MRIVLTSAGPLGAEPIEAARLALAPVAGEVRAPRRLAADAVEIGFEGPREAALAATRSALADEAIDVNLGVDGPMRLLICDMDSTIIGCECIDEIADMAGVGPRVAAITERAMRGEIDFDGALTERVGLLTGLPEATLEQVFAERVTLNKGAKALVLGMREMGALTALVSGGFEFFTERVASEAGFERNQANRLEVADGRLTGRPVPPILGQAAKLDALTRMTAELGASPAEAVAVGDGANDLAMIRAAGLGVAYRAKPVVAAEADAQINHSDLTAVLRILGKPASNLT